MGINMYVNPGELNKRIDICQIAEKDKYGFRNKEPTVIMSRWAKVTKISGKETDGAGTDTSESSVQFLIRYSKNNIDTNMLVRYCGKLHEISDVEDIQERHEYLKLTCKRGEM